MRHNGVLERFLKVIIYAIPFIMNISQNPDSEIEDWVGASYFYVGVSRGILQNLIKMFKTNSACTQNTKCWIKGHVSHKICMCFVNNHDNHFFINPFLTLFMLSIHTRQHEQRWKDSCICNKGKRHWWREDGWGWRLAPSWPTPAKILQHAWGLHHAAAGLAKLRPKCPLFLIMSATGYTYINNTI